MRIAGKPFEVVGLLARVGTQLSRDRIEIDEQAWIPITTLQATGRAGGPTSSCVSKIIYRMREPRR